MDAFYLELLNDKEREVHNLNCITSAFNVRFRKLPNEEHQYLIGNILLDKNRTTLKIDIQTLSFICLESGRSGYLDELALKNKGGHNVW